LLARPEPIEVMALLPDHPPASFTWRGVRRLVKRADGPERIFGEWWKRDAELAAVRDYFQVEDDAGERFWLFRSGNEEQAAAGPVAGSCTEFSHETALFRASGHIPLLVPARGEQLR
jgi:protein ImuB